MQSHVTKFSMIVALLFSCAELHAQGLILSGAGAVNRGMAGASTAGSMDAAGAGFWNPAGIRAVPHDEVMFSAELPYVDIHLSSAGPGGSGVSLSDSGWPQIPTIAAVYHSETMPVTYGLGIYALLGGGVNFPGAADNPILARTGPVYASAAALGIQPSLAVQITDRLTVGAGPIISAITLGLNPAFFEGGEAPYFPVATPGRPFWGGGFQIGLLYEPNCAWDLGFSYKSPVWYQTLEYHAQDASGNANRLFLDQNMPQIYSMGAAFHGWERTTISLDVRYLDYASTTLWGDSLQEGGLGWQSIWSVAIGAQRQVTDRLTLRMGYRANENPIPDVATLFNIQLPALTQHELSVGGSLQLTEAIRADTALVYGFGSSIEGPVPIPGPPPGDFASVSLSAELISLVFGLSFRY